MISTLQSGRDSRAKAKNVDQNAWETLDILSLKDKGKARNLMAEIRRRS